MPSLSTMTVSQLAQLTNAPVEQVSGPRKAKTLAMLRMAMQIHLKNHLQKKGLKRKSESRTEKLSTTKKKKVVYNRQDFTIRRLGGKIGVNGKNGSFLRIAIHKISRKTYKVNEKNWTEAGNSLYERLHPDELDVKKNLAESRKEKKKNKALRIYEKEMQRRAKMEESFKEKYGEDLLYWCKNEGKVLEQEDTDNESIMEDGFVC